MMIAVIRTIARPVLAWILYLLDLGLKYALGVGIVWLVWLPFGTFRQVSFSLWWFRGGMLLGACLVGLWDGCDMILIGLVKRILGDK
jgi:hypothetical protein